MSLVGPNGEELDESPRAPQNVPTICPPFAPGTHSIRLGVVDMVGKAVGSSLIGLNGEKLVGGQGSKLVMGNFGELGSNFFSKMPRTKFPQLGQKCMVAKIMAPFDPPSPAAALSPANQTIPGKPHTPRLACVTLITSNGRGSWCSPDTMG